MGNLLLVSTKDFYVIMKWFCICDKTTAGFKENFLMLSKNICLSALIEAQILSDK